MKISDSLEKYFITPSDCPKFNENNPDYRCMVDEKTNYRKNKALSESKKNIKPVKEIINYTMEFLEKIGIASECIKIEYVKIEEEKINYEKIKTDYLLSNKKNIIWMKFTKDGYLGVVAASDDINFSYKNNSGKLISHVNKEWNEELVLIFPLPNIQRYERDEIEKALGNYLIAKDVPIIDYYSHNLGK